MPSEEQLREIVRECRGWKYKPRGREPGQVDCFGLVLFVMGRLGVEIPDYRYDPDVHRQGYAEFLEHYHEHAVEVLRGDLAPGDVIMFRNGSRALNHIAVYIGRGWFVQCTENGVSV
ncbi:MAG: NlpC/P60 family protein, partial [Lentisphaerota bacterium]